MLTMTTNLDVCRCCLTEHPTITYNIFERDNLRNDLIECVPKLHIEPNDGLPDSICDLCWLRVREAVDFRKKCEESDRELRIQCNAPILFTAADIDNQNIGNAATFNGMEIAFNALQVLDKTVLSQDETILSDATIELCELTPLEVDMLNELIIEDGANQQQNPTNLNAHREEDPIIAELLNTVLNDTENDLEIPSIPIIEKIISTTSTTETPPLLQSASPQPSLPVLPPPSIEVDQSTVITSTTTNTTTATTKPTARTKSNRKRKPPPPTKQSHSCTECSKTFTRNFQLKLHLTSVHSIGDGLQYQCNVCDKTFASRHSLNYHQKSLHTEERNHVCTQCDRRFVLRSQLASHERIHTGESKPRIHECPKCDKTWPTKSDLRTHMRTHDPNVVRRFQCDQCEKRFFTRGHLSSHLLVHSGEKPFTCAICEKSYQSIGNLNNHMVKRHSDVVLNRSRQRNADQRTLIET